MSNFKGTYRVASDIELKHIGNGLAIANFSIVMDRYNAKKLKEEGKQSADFVNVQFWNKQAEFIAQYLHKGKFVEVEGDLQIDIVGEGNDRQYYTKIKGNQVKIIEWGNVEDVKPKKEVLEGFQSIEDNSDLPF